MGEERCRTSEQRCLRDGAEGQKTRKMQFEGEGVMRGPTKLASEVVEVTLRMNGRDQCLLVLHTRPV